MLVWGATGGIGALRRAVRAQRRRHAGRRRVVARAGPSCCTSWACEARHRPQGRRATSSGTTSTPRTRREWRRLRQGHPRAWSATTPTSCSSTPAAQTMGASVFVAQAGRHDRHLRGDERLHDRVRQPLPLDEAEDASRARHFANYREAWEANRLIVRGQDPADAVGGLPARRDRRGRLPGAPQPARGQDRRAVPRARGGPRHRPTRVARARSARTRSRCSAAWQPEATDDTTCCSPRSTTSPSPSTTSRPRSTTTARRSACEVEHREVVESDGVEEALLKVADSYIQLLTPTRDDSTGRQVPREARARACTTSATGSTTAPRRSSR